MFIYLAKLSPDLIVVDPWIWKILITAVILACSYFLVKAVVTLLHKKFFKEINVRRIHYIFLKPFLVILWVVGITYALDVVASQYKYQNLENSLRAFRNTFILLSILWLIFRWKKQLLVHLLSQEKKLKATDRTTLEFIFRIITIFAVFVVLLLILQFWGVNIIPLLAFGGVGAAVIGFASQDMIANFFGSVMLHSTRPFSKGDVVDIPEKKLFGVIEEIGWYMSMIRDFEKCPHYIPNSLFSKLYVKNISRRSNWRIDEKISVRYEDFSKIPELTKKIYTYLYEHPQIENKLPIYVNFSNYGAYSLDIHVRVYTKTPRYDMYIHARHEILLEIKNIMQQLGADVPFPTTTVHLSKEKSL